MLNTSSKDLMTKLVAAHVAEERAKQQATEAGDRTRLQMTACVESGMTMSKIAAAVGLSENGARSRLKTDPTKPGAWESVKKRAADSSAKRALPRTRTQPPAPRGYARVKDAVTALGITRAGVHYRINAGQLATLEVNGERFVRIPEWQPGEDDEATAI